MSLALYILLFSVGALGSAYVAQYGFGLEPCILCLYQRIPFAVSAVLSAIALFFKGKVHMLLVAFCGISFLVGAGIAFYQVGIEQGVFEMTDGCADDLSQLSFAEMQKQIIGKPAVQCDTPQFVFLGISMAGWNFFFSSIAGIIVLSMVGKMFQALRYIKKSNDYKK